MFRKKNAANDMLLKSLESRNILDIFKSIELGANPLNKDHSNTLEKILNTPDCEEIVKECLKVSHYPCDYNPILQTRLISYAAKLKDPLTANYLLLHPAVNTYTQYPLSWLARSLNNANADDVFKCMNILLENGASPNRAEQESKSTPLQIIVQNDQIDDVKKREFIQLFFKRPEFDIHRHWLGKLRTILQQKYPDFKLPEKHTVTYEMLYHAILNNDMEKFQNYYKFKKISQEENQNLLVHSIRLGSKSTLAFDLIMESGVDYKAISSRFPPAIAAIRSRNCHALEMLLKKPDIIKPHYPHNLLVELVNFFNKHSQDVLIRKCFSILMDSKRMDINKLDHFGYTALHYAARYRNELVVKELLKRGADICIKNKYNKLAIEAISPKLLEEHFDYCVATNFNHPDSKEFGIVINFKNLISEHKSSSSDLKDIMAPIIFMANSQEHGHLLQHPVITSFLFLKWRKISFVFYINFVLYLLYAVSMVLYVLLKFRESGYETAQKITSVLSGIGTVYLIIRECLQFIAHPLRYITSLKNYVEVILCFLSIQTLTESHRNIAVFTILLVAVELCFVVGYLPFASIATHMQMLQAVCKSFWKSFLLYSILIITFALGFYIMHAKPDNDESFGNFRSPLDAITKTIVMLTGEFDAGSLKFDTYYSYLLFLLFVCFMTIILFNLLNGLAVSDTQAIQDQGDLNYIMCRANLLARYQKLVIDRSKDTKSLVNYSPLREIFKYFQNLFHDFDLQVTIFPNDNNKILKKNLKLINRMENVSNNDDETIVHLTNETESVIVDRKTCWTRYFHFITAKCCQMDDRIVKMANETVQRNHDKEVEMRSESVDEKMRTFGNYMEESIKEKVKKLEKYIKENTEEKMEQLENNIATKLEENLQKIFKYIKGEGL